MQKSVRSNAKKPTPAEPENLYPEHREEITKQLAKLLKTAECIRLISAPGLGKSKYLRYISQSETVQKKYFKEANVKLIYIDLNRVYQKTHAQLIEVLAEKVGAEIPTLRALEQEIHKMLENYTCIYLILDNADLLNGFDAESANIITSILNSFKKKVAFILAFSSDKQLDKEKFSYLDDHSQLSVIFTPQSKEEMKKTIDQFAGMYGIKLNNAQKDKILKSSKGSPLICKWIFSKLLLGSNIDTATAEFSSTAQQEDNNQFKEVTSHREQNKMDMREIQKYLTKSEFLFLQEMLKHKGYIVSRDEFALILSPQSNGDGVSNEAIDQVISRLRKTVEKNDLPYSIQTKRGIGYYME